MAPEDAAPTGELASSDAEAAGAVVCGSVQRTEQLSAKTFGNQWRLPREPEDLVLAAARQRWAQVQGAK